MGKTKFVFIGLLLIQSFSVLAQKDRYVVFFQDKAQSEFSVNNPEEFLSQRAIQRRQRQGIAILERDLPVNRNYVDQVSALGVETYFTSKWMNCLLVEATQEEIAEVESLAVVSAIEFVAPGEQLGDFVDNAPELGPFFSPSDTELSSDFQLRMLRADAMHDDGFTGEGMMIAVLDGGFIGLENSMAFQHLATENKLLLTRDLTLNQSNVYRSVSHGTSVVSCISANFGDQMVGTAFDASVALFITEDGNSEFRVEEYNWLFAAEMADSMGVDVINSSLGYRDFDDPSMDYGFDELDGQTSVIARANDMAFDTGMIVVTSAGNTSSNLTSPADAFNVLAVGAVDIEGQKATFSAFFDSSDGRTKPEVVALGRNTVVINGGGNIGTRSGTSFSSPLVAGLAAGVWQSRPELTNRQVVDLIINSSSLADDVSDLLGYGIPNYLEISGATVTSSQDELEGDLLIYPNPIQNNLLTIANTGADLGGAQLVISDLSGKVLQSEKLSLQEKQTIDVSGLSAATYLVTILNKGKITTKKVFKR